MHRNKAALYDRSNDATLSFWSHSLCIRDLEVPPPYTGSPNHFTLFRGSTFFFLLSKKQMFLNSVVDLFVLIIECWLIFIYSLFNVTEV